MRLSTLTASTATLLLSSTALLAQEAQQSATTGFQNVYVDVDGSAVQVPVDLAAQACALDAATLQQVAQTRLGEAGMDAESIPGLMSADAGSAAGIDASGGLSDIEATPTDTADATGSVAATASGDMATADAATSGMTEGAEPVDSTTTADASSTPAPGSQPVQVDDSSVMAEANSPAGQEGSTSVDGSNGVATADASGAAAEAGVSAEVGSVESTAADNTTVTNAQGTADPSTTNPGEQYLALAVCQIDVTRASELGIPNIANETVTE